MNWLWLMVAAGLALPAGAAPGLAAVSDTPADRLPQVVRMDPAASLPAARDPDTATPGGAAGTPRRAAGTPGYRARGTDAPVPDAPAFNPSSRGAPAPGDPARAGWQWPLRPRPDVVRGFAPPARRWLAGHRGVDLTAGIGQEVRAPADGVVVFSGRVAGTPVVSLGHGVRLRSTYQPVTGSVPTGRTVRAGEVIGYLSHESGHCAPAACLHWGSLRDRTYVDPLALLRRTPIVLLPLR